MFPRSRGEVGGKVQGTGSMAGIKALSPAAPTTFLR